MNYLIKYILPLCLVLLLVGCSSSDETVCLKDPKFDLEECGIIQDGKKHGIWFTKSKGKPLYSHLYNKGVIERESHYYYDEVLYFINRKDNVISDTIYVFDKEPFDKHFKDNWTTTSVFMYFEKSTGKFKEAEPEYKINHKWDSTEIASATLYLYIPEKAREENPAYRRRENEIITSNGSLNKYIIPSHTKELDSLGVIDLKNILTRDYYESFPVSACFEPHHGIIMKDIEGNVLGHVSICFQCDNYHIYPFRVNAPIKSFKELFSKNGFPIHRGAVYQLDKEE